MSRAVTTSLAFALAVATIGGSAGAQSGAETDYSGVVNASAGFVRNNVGTSPQTQSELIMCAAYWRKWSEMVTIYYSESQIAQLPAEMKPEASKRIHDAIFAAALATIDKTDRAALERADADFEEQYENANASLVANGMDRNNVQFFATLGSCGVP